MLLTWKPSASRRGSFFQFIGSNGSGPMGAGAPAGITGRLTMT